MHNDPRHTDAGQTGGRQFREALDRLEGLVVEGLKHGFFDYSIACETFNGKLQFVIRAGKSHKFTIPKEELPR